MAHRIYVPVVDILKVSGAKYKESHRYYKLRCINPGHNDKTPSAVIYKDSGAYYCFSCGYSLTNYQLGLHFGLIKDKKFEKPFLVPPTKEEKKEEETFLSLPKHYDKIEGDFEKLNLNKDIIDTFNIGACKVGFEGETLTTECDGCPYKEMWVKSGRCGLAYGRIMFPVYKDTKLYVLESRLILNAYRGKKILYPSGSKTSQVIWV